MFALTKCLMFIAMFLGLLCCGFDVQCSVHLKSGFLHGLAEWIYTFIITNTTIKIILLIMNIPVYFLLGRLIFGSWKRFWRVVFWRALMFSLIPLFILFRRDIFRRPSLKPPSWTEIRLSIVLNFLWLALYFAQYILIKMIFLN